MNISELTHAICAGTLSPFPYALLNTPQSSLKPDLRDLILTYAHFNCHFWSIATLKANEDLDVVLIKHEGNILHSITGSIAHNLFFDANGIHTLTNAKAYWQRIVHREPVAERISGQLLCDLILPEADELEKTTNDIMIWLKHFKPIHATKQPEI